MQRLGELSISKKTFSGLDHVFKEFKLKKFLELSLTRQIEYLCQALLNLIKAYPSNGFALPAVLDFIERVREEQVIDHFHFNHFEWWMNHHSGLSPEENLYIRGKIAGRYVPRDEYQTLFPIGMGKTYQGTHFVTAHTSPDLDTTVASFWGWVDAFAARVTEGIHVWNVPGGKPPEQIETQVLFYTPLGKQVFNTLAKHKTALSISGMDLVSQKGMIQKTPEDSVVDLEPDQKPSAVVLVDHQGSYLGEWRSSDMDRVRAVVNLLNQCLRWYENELHVKLISLFTEEHLSQKSLKHFFHVMHQMVIEACEPATEFSDSQKEALESYLTRVLHVPNGMRSTFAEFSKSLAQQHLFGFEEFARLSMDMEIVFDPQGNVTSKRADLFLYLTRVISALSKAVFQLRQYVDQISNALQVKSRVLGVRPHHVNYKADLDEIKDRIENEPYLTVTLSDEKGTPFPLGVIHASDLFKPSLGTVSLRDFSNREETKIPSYLDVISILDHHKSQLSTTAASIAWISDAQSSNSLVAKMSFTISDRYTTAGMGESDIAAQIEELKKDLSSSSNKRILQKLLQKQLAVGQKKNFFVSPEREIMEYLHCLYAILDDTDLLSKVSSFDVECVAEILNRLKTLSLKKEVEIIHFDDLPRDANFAKKGAMRILQNDDMYSLYQKIYKAKEEAMEEHLHLAAREQESALFADTKEQNGCCRVGQTKLFSRNFATFQKQAFSLQKAWLQKAMEIYTARSEIDFHLHMISTIAGAEELHAGQKTHYSHQDELWLWTPSTEMGLDHLKSFLSRFRNCPQVQNNTLSVEFLGENAEEMKAVFDESFLAIPKASVKKGLSMAVLKYQAATLNSRKAVISPYLPTIL